MDLLVVIYILVLSLLILNLVGIIVFYKKINKVYNKYFYEIKKDVYIKTHIEFLSLFGLIGIFYATESSIASSIRTYLKTYNYI